MPCEPVSPLPKLLQKRKSMEKHERAVVLLKLLVSILVSLALLVSDHEGTIYDLMRGVLQLLR
jgi:hypothetical protein